ncbi:MAG: hypothetical protein KDA61_18845, partial [Planctomycetales bacterium]|nr:hypothetical protein [Planctomycetales bacterium]
MNSELNLWADSIGSKMGLEEWVASRIDWLDSDDASRASELSFNELLQLANRQAMVFGLFEEAE